MRNNKQKSMSKIFFNICLPNLQIGNLIRMKEKTISVLETSHTLELPIHGEYMFWMWSWKKKSILCKKFWAFIYDHTKTRSTYACKHHHKTLSKANLFNVKYMKVLFLSANYGASRHEIIVISNNRSPVTWSDLFWILFPCSINSRDWVTAHCSEVLIRFSNFSNLEYMWLCQFCQSNIRRALYPAN